jgi:hypothetical protein
MVRALKTVPLLLLLAAPARASPYWIDYEPSSGHFPEDPAEGWYRVTNYGGDQRSIEDAWLVMDGMGDPRIQDYCIMWMNGALNPDGPGQRFEMQWRIRVDALIWYDDPIVGVFADDGWAVGFKLSDSAIYSAFEDGVSAPFEPGVAHAFDFSSSDMRAYTLSIDGVQVIGGNFCLTFTDPQVMWGDGVCGGASLARWQYFRFGVVPECNGCIVAIGGFLCLFRSRAGR